MILKIVVLGTDNTLLVHNFSKYKKKDLNLYKLENFNKDSSIFVDSGEIESIYNSVKYTLAGENFDELYSIESDFGIPILDEKTKEVFYKIISSSLDNDVIKEDFTNYIKTYLTKKGLIYDNTEIIVSKELENKDLTNKYLWLNFGIDSVYRQYFL